MKTNVQLQKENEELTLMLAKANRAFISLQRKCMLSTTGMIIQKEKFDADEIKRPKFFGVLQKEKRIGNSKKTAYARKWREKNAEHYREYQRKYQKEYRKNYGHQ